MNSRVASCIFNNSPINEAVCETKRLIALGVPGRSFNDNKTPKRGIKMSRSASNELALY